MPADFPEFLEIQVFHLYGGRRLVSAIKIVSPSNKDRPESRRAFAIKCASYLQQGVGLVIVDLVTNRRANLHNELIDLLETGSDFKLPTKAPLYVVAYRPVRTEDIERIDIWPTRVKTGENLPLVPLALGTGICVPLNLEAAYADMCRRLRL
ncbi:MAG TPA: DUF4058 family protein [Gemmataceae bacterium]|nr:DUF4058 family protein [Gemmataceae bacterium]